MGRIVNNFGNPIGIDSGTRVLETIDYAHHEVHSGSHYFAGYSAALTSGDVITVGITTPNTTKWDHLLLGFNSADEAYFELLEDVTSFSGGAAIIAYNNNRNKQIENPSGTVLIAGHTGTNLITPTGGTVIYAEYYGEAGATPSRSGAGGGNRNDNELILKQNTNYLLRITDTSASGNNSSITLEWYEHTDKTD